MNPEIKAQWIAALRSGEYRQGVGKLRSSHDDYCCLGVLCELAVNANAVHRKTSVVAYQYGVRGFIGFMPDEVVQWAGLDSPDPIVTVPGQEAHPLSYLNDAIEATFAEIADAIESSDI